MIHHIIGMFAPVLSSKYVRVREVFRSPKVFSPEGDCTIVRGQYQGRNKGTWSAGTNSKRLRRVIQRLKAF